MTQLSDCCNAPIRYLDCERCRRADIKCIYVCIECGCEVEFDDEET